MKKRGVVKTFKKELNQAIATAITAAFGFIIALEWREVISGALQRAIALSPLQGKIASALIITFLSVIGIIIVTHAFRGKQ